MIFIDRQKEPEPQVLADPHGEAADEIARAAEFYRKAIAARAAQPAPALSPTGKRSRKQANPSFNFKVYKADEVKGALARLFHGKCAYCEHIYVTGTSGDVEHYRPKKVITYEEKKEPHWPGYYWLAARWTNLLPSCPRCNRLHREMDHGVGKKRTYGKHEWFPLEEESSRVFDPSGDLTKEKPLLLDPTVDRPGEHLEFSDNDKHRALLNARTKRGEATISILGLNRATLVLARQKFLGELAFKMKDLERAYIRASNAATAEAARDFLDEIREKKAQLDEYRLDRQEFAALARQELEKFFATLNQGIVHSPSAPAVQPPSAQ